MTGITHTYASLVALDWITIGGATSTNDTPTSSTMVPTHKLKEKFTDDHCRLNVLFPDLLFLFVCSVLFVVVVVVVVILVLPFQSGLHRFCSF